MHALSKVMCNIHPDYLPTGSSRNWRTKMENVTADVRLGKKRKSEWNGQTDAREKEKDGHSISSRYFKDIL